MLHKLTISKNGKKIKSTSISLRFISANEGKYFSVGISIRGIDFWGFVLKLTHPSVLNPFYTNV